MICEVMFEMMFVVVCCLCEKVLVFVVFNFVLVKNFGGGFLGGVQVQEEDLCCGSGFYFSLILFQVEFYYVVNCQFYLVFYIDYFIYSLQVFIFWDDVG